MKKGIIILASSKSQGETRQLADYLSKKLNHPVIDLNQKTIGHFDYEFKNSDDDFLPIIREIVENYELILFATPVYWYTMSGLLKVFFDRFSDCLKKEKELGRKLRGRQMAVLSCGYDKELKPGFYIPFRETANYLGMQYVADVHGWVREKGEISEEVKVCLDDFVEELTSA